MAAVTAPLVQTFSAVVPAAAQAAGAETTILVAAYGATITSVTYVANTAITGADTHTRKVSLVNKKADASGTDEAAALQFNQGVDAAAFVGKAITNGTLAKRTLAAGDVVTWASAKVGNGLADPGGTVIVTLERN